MPNQRRQKPKVPPGRLEASIKPSKRNPAGAPRCQFWEPANKARENGRELEPKAKLWQCPNKARDGFRACGMHGAGHAKREREGKRQNPAAAAIVHGEDAKPETLKALFESKPEFLALYQEQLNSDSLLDFRPELAMSKALVRYFIDRAKLDSMDDSFGQTPPALAAIDRLERVIAAGERCLKVEANLGAITHEEMRWYFYCVARTLHRFVPAKLQAEAKTFLSSGLRSRDPTVMGSAERLDEDGRGDA